MHYLIVSFTHKNSAIAMREKLSFSNDEQISCLTKLKESSSINEAILIHTCNRTEIFVSCSSIMSATQYIFELLHQRIHISIEELEGRADIFDNQGAIHHLFTVASSLDSLIIGETQVTGQLKDAFRNSLDKGFCGQKLSRAMHYAFRCAARVRNLTNISSRPVSIASVAIAKLKEVIHNIENKQALVIGVGEMSEITIKHLLANKVKVHITNRTYKHAKTLAQKYDIKIIDFTDLPDAINRFEIIFTATSSQEPIITDKDINKCCFERFWFDMAMPRDIKLEDTKHINLFQIDDLKSVANINVHLREDEAKSSYEIIGRQTMQFYEWLQTLSVEPIIKHLYLKADSAAEIETTRVVTKKYLPKKYEKQLLKMNQQVLKRFLHGMVDKLRDISGNSDADTVIESLKFLLNDNNATLLNEYKCEHIIKG